MAGVITRSGVCSLTGSAREVVSMWVCGYPEGFAGWVVSASTLLGCFSVGCS